MAEIKKLAERFAIVTGGSRGLGLEICRHFVAAGAGVLLTGRDADALEQASAVLAPLAARGAVVEAMAGDVSSPEVCRQVMLRALELARHVDILVNNAGIYGPLGPLDQVDWSQFVEAFEINFFGTALMCREVTPAMRRRGYGKIINLSGGGAASPLPRFNAYAASKAAVVRLTENLAEELRDAHVDVNAIAPGALNTRLLDQALEAGPQLIGQAQYDKSLRQRDDGGAAPAKGAALAVFLASADSDGITGKLLSAVWDNWADLPRHREKLAKGDIYALRRIVPEDRGEKW